VPISLFAYITEMRIVLSVIAWRSPPRRPPVRPHRNVRHLVTLPLQALAHVQVAPCSMAVVTDVVALLRYISANTFDGEIDRLGSAD